MNWSCVQYKVKPLNSMTEAKLCIYTEFRMTLHKAGYSWTVTA